MTKRYIDAETMLWLTSCSEYSWDKLVDYIPLRTWEIFREEHYIDFENPANPAQKNIILAWLFEQGYNMKFILGVIMFKAWASKNVLRMN